MLNPLLPNMVKIGRSIHPEARAKERNLSRVLFATNTIALASSNESCMQGSIKRALLEEEDVNGLQFHRHRLIC